MARGPVIMDVSVVFAARDEEGNIRPLHSELRKAVGKNVEIIGVDDGSSDGTLAEMASISDPLFRVILLGAKSGKSRAIHAGIAVSSGDVIVTIDADLQNDPEDIPRMLSMVEKGSEFVCGWRSERADGRAKRFESRVGNAVGNWVLGTGVHDSSCPLKAFRRECMQGVPYFRNLHRFMPAVAMKRGFSVDELEVSHRPRAKGKSKYGIKNRILGNVLTLIKLKAGLIDLGEAPDGKKG